MSRVRRLLDGYDYVADVPRGTPLLVESGDGRVWRLARKGIRYHSDVLTSLHGARPARAPAPVAASARIRALIDAVILGGGELPEGAEPPRTVWRDAPGSPGSLAPTATLAVYADGWICASRPVYDDAPRTGARHLDPREAKALARDIERAPRGVRLQCVAVRERMVRVEADDPRIEAALLLPGARAWQTTRTWPGDAAAYAVALAAPQARLAFDGGPVDVPVPGTAWDVPLAAWRALCAADDEANAADGEVAL